MCRPGAATCTDLWQNARNSFSSNTFVDCRVGAGDAAAVAPGHAGAVCSRSRASPDVFPPTSSALRKRGEVADNLAGVPRI